MDIRQYAINAAERTDAALATGNVEEAIQYSGEATATLDAEWTRLYNAKEKDCDAALIAGTFVAGRHLVALLHGGASDEAFSMGMLLLYRSTLARKKSAELAQAQLDVMIRLLSATLEVGDRAGFTSPSADATDVDHFAHIVSYIASMLYAFYTEVGNSRPDTPILEEAYALLQQMQELGAIQHPTIRIKDADVETSDIAALLPDLLGRSKALGLLKAD